MKYVVSIRGENEKEFVLEAPNIIEASKIIKKKYPNHLGYNIKPTQ